MKVAIRMNKKQQREKRWSVPCITWMVQRIAAKQNACQIEKRSGNGRRTQSLSKLMAVIVIKKAARHGDKA